MKREWSLHPRFGRQFKLVESKIHIPVTVEGIERYLGSGLVKGIGPEMAKRIGMIRKAREVMIFLQSHGVSPAYGAKIFRQYGNRALRVVTENPYQLAEEIFGIGFLTADRIAASLGFVRDREARAQAGLLHVLQQCSEEGHTYYPQSQLIERSGEFLDIDKQIIAGALQSLAKNTRLVLETLTE